MVRLSGWQKHPKSKVWHFYPGGPFYSFSACQKQTRKSWPLAAEPENLNLCTKCIAEMRKMVRKIERREQRQRTE